MVRREATFRGYLRQRAHPALLADQLREVDHWRAIRAANSLSQ